MLAMRTILFPTDFSAEAGSAFEVASALAADSRGRLVMLHVEPSPLTSLGDIAGVPPLPDEYDRPGTEEALQRLQSPRSGFTVERRLEYGYAASVILQTAREIGADLIVMGTHGRTGLRRLLMGSVAEKVVRKASCPVLTVRTPMETMLSLPSAVEESALT
jgi:nucleotide-binding universal stress UspA family protein